MSHQTRILLAPRDESYVVVVEPWANEFQVHAREPCEIVVFHPWVPPTFEIDETSSWDTIVWVNEGGATYEFWRAGVRELEMFIPIPSIDSRS